MMPSPSEAVVREEVTKIIKKIAKIRTVFESPWDVLFVILKDLRNCLFINGRKELFWTIPGTEEQG